jgi:hypothetical protein
MMINNDTGLTDDYGTPIKDGDTIIWTYKAHGIMVTDDDGKERFIAGVTGGEMIEKELVQEQVIKYEIKEDSAGYFLDRPRGIGQTFIKEKPKCKVKVDE